MPKVQLINPTLSQNIPTVVALMKSVHGTKPGRLHPYEIYTLNEGMGKQSSFALTLPVLQFIEDRVPDSTRPEFRLDIVEPTPEDNGQFGHILPVIKSIISKQGAPDFDKEGVYVVKEISAPQNALPDKPNKPNWFVRAANREQYLGSQLPTLGIRYGLIKEERVSFLHMNRAPGLPLDTYGNKLNAEQFLSLACALLEDIPQQIHQTVRFGKHKGEKIVHCDLKSQNIMADLKDLKSKPTVTAVDMGLAKTIKGDKYSSFYPQGNLMVWDSKMLLALLKQEPIDYNTQTDIYALYVTILELAGAPSRESLNNEEMLADLQKPNLTGIFNHMGFDPITKHNLTRLAERMLCDNRSLRISREEVLKELKEALVHVQKINNDLLQKRTGSTSESVPPEEKEKVTAEDLKNWVEQPLDYLVAQNEQKGQHKKATLKLWIKHFRQLSFLAGAEEVRRFGTMFSRNEIHIYSRFIYDLMRFNLIREYDNNACARLLLRNEQLTAPLREPYPLSQEWQKFFDLLLNLLPIQLTTIDASFCEEIGTFKKNVSSILITPISEDPQSLLWHMSESLKRQSSLHFLQWAEELPLFARVFNQQYLCLGHVSRLSRQYSNVYFLKEHSKEIKEWTEEITKNAINATFPKEADYFAKYDTLGVHLNDFAKLLKKIQILYSTFPLLNQSSISLAAIGQSIKNFTPRDTQGAVDLSLKLELLLTLNEVFSNTSRVKENYPHTQYPTVMETGINQLTKLINQYPPEREFIVELQRLLDYFEAINDLDAFIEEHESYENIVNAFLLLMAGDLSKVLQLEAMTQNDAEKHLGKLDWGLKPLLSLPSSEQLNEKLLAEITRFYSFPARYMPMHTRSNPNTLFQPIEPVPPTPPASKTEETRVPPNLYQNYSL